MSGSPDLFEPLGSRPVDFSKEADVKGLVADGRKPEIIGFNPDGTLAVAYAPEGGVRVVFSAETQVGSVPVYANEAGEMVGVCLAYVEPGMLGNLVIWGVVDNRKALPVEMTLVSEAAAWIQLGDIFKRWTSGW